MYETKFRKFHLKEHLLKALDQQHIIYPTKIQDRLIPSILNGKSVIGQSQTGTGKTLTYLLPIVHKLDVSNEKCQTVITVPTRELSEQIYQEIVKLLPEKNPFRIKKIVGGTDQKRLLKQLKMQPHVVIGTPRRISELIREQVLNVYPSSTLVIDEIDVMCEMGFIKDVDFIASRMAENLQILVFSATIPEHLQPFLKKYMENPKFVQIDAKQANATNVENFLVFHRHRELSEILIQIVSMLQPYLGLIFVNTKTKANELYTKLVEAGYNVERLHGGLTPRERKKAMKRIEKLECEYIVATDLASRGIDIKGISHVINAEMPEDLNFFIHRIGRTGRANVSGQTITIYRQEDIQNIKKLEKKGISFKHVDIKNGEWIEISSLKHKIKR